MTGKSQANLIAAAIESAEKIVKEQTNFISLLKDLSTTVENPILDFDEESLSFSWKWGRSKFRKGAFEPFCMLQALYNAEDHKLLHAELAGIVYGDDLAPVYQCAYHLAEKLQQCGCPFQLGKDSEYFWLF